MNEVFPLHLSVVEIDTAQQHCACGLPRSSNMHASPVRILLIALILQCIAAAPLISPGLHPQDLNAEDKSIVKFHLVANTDVTMKVFSKGLVCAPNLV